MKNITVEIIHRAMDGDKEALLKILKHYEHYIDKYAMVTKTMPDGKIHHFVDEDRKAKIQYALIYAIKHKYKTIKL